MLFHGMALFCVSMNWLICATLSSEAIIGSNNRAIFNTLKHVIPQAKKEKMKTAPR